MKVKGAIIQSCYLPWKGYFDIINDVDLFVFLDDVQYTARDWRNRNSIKTRQGLLWLTVPVGTKRNRLIQDVTINQHEWQNKHYKSIKHHYGKATHYQHIEPLMQRIYAEHVWGNLSELNQFITREIAQHFLGIDTEFINAASLHVSGKKTARLIEICKITGITHYVSGPSARDYIDPSLFKKAEIGMEFKEYSGYPTYQQLYPPFAHHVSILDLLAQTGADAADYIWGYRKAS